MEIKIHLGLVHAPVKNKWGKEVVTSVTNLDVHDIARTCRTYGLKSFLIITPVWAQHQLLEKMLGYWETDEAGIYNPHRQQALDLVKIVVNLEAAIQAVREVEGGSNPLLAVTGANISERVVEVDEVLEGVRESSRPLLLLFGTGHGLIKETIEKSDYPLRPIYGIAEDGYNHLSVRSAIAIYCERLKLSLDKMKSLLYRDGQ